MTSLSALPTIIANLSLTATAWTTFPAALYLVRRPQTYPKSGWGPASEHRGEGEALYKDYDGVTTPEEQRRFSNRAGKTFILLVAAVGLALALVLAIVSAVTWHSGNGDRARAPAVDCIGVAAWALAVIQAIAIGVCPDSVRAYDLGLNLTTAGWLIGLSAFYQVTTGDLPHVLENTPLSFWLRFACFVNGFVLLIAGITLPRRPSVFFDGVEIDRSRTVSGAVRYTWSWAWRLYIKAIRTGVIDVEDLPRLDSELRAADVRITLGSYNFDPHTESIWKLIWRANHGLLIWIWTLSAVKAVAMALCSWILLQLMRMLDSKVPGEAATAEMWMMIIWWLVAVLAVHVSIYRRASLSSQVYRKQALTSRSGHTRCLCGTPPATFFSKFASS